MKKRVALESKQKLKFLLLNAIQVKKLKQIDELMKQAEGVITAHKEKCSLEKTELGEWVQQIDQIFNKMKQYSKPQLVLKDQDMELIGKMSIV